MGIARDHRFSVTFDEAFERGLVLVGEVSPDNEYQQDRNKPARQKVDELTGKRRWKATCTDPAADKAKNASIEVILLADVQPVPTTPEIVPGLGMRQVELEGLMVQPKVVGSGEYKGQGFVYFATGFKPSATGRESRPQTSKPNNSGNGESATKAA
jgi:hypothetical protein